MTINKHKINFDGRENLCFQSITSKREKTISFISNTWNPNQNTDNLDSKILKTFEK
jgi:hypothetical protein